MRFPAFVLVAGLTIGGARASDHDSIDTVTTAVYETISGPAGPRDWDRFRALFIDGARLIVCRATADGATPVVMTPEDFAKRAGANSATNGFFESEVARRVETFG